MSGRVLGLMGHSAVYMAANLLQRGLAFILIPLYAAYFTTAEFGAMDLLFQLALTLALVTSLALPQGLVRGFSGRQTGDDSVDSRPGNPPGEEERAKILGALASLLLPILLASTAGLLIFAEPIARALFQGEGNALWVRLAALLYLALSLQQLPLQLHRTEQRSALYAGWSLASFILVAGGNIVFIVFLKMGLPGMLWGNLLGAACTALPLLFLLLPKLKFNMEWSRLAPLFAFALPILPNLLCRKAMEFGSRAMIPHWHGLAEAGVFSMAARTASILEVLLLVPFLSAWHPFLYSQTGKPGTPAMLARISHYFLMLLLGGMMFMHAFREPLLGFLGRGKFDTAGPAASWLALAMVFCGMQYVVSSGFHLKRRLGREMALMAATASLNLLLNFLLIPPFGATGAAASSAIAFGAFFAASLILSQRLYPIPYPWLRLAAVAVPALCAFAVLAKVETEWARAACLAAFGAAVALDLWKHGEFARTSAILSARFLRPVAQAAIHPASKREGL